MDPAISRKPPTWYWVAASLALLWMLFGVFALYLDFMTDEAALARMTEAQRQLHAARPQWLFGVYTIAIFSGLAGTIGLLLRKSWSILAFAVSLTAVVVQFGYIFLGMDAIRIMGAAAAVPFPLVIVLIAILLLWLARAARRRGWISA